MSAPSQSDARTEPATRVVIPARDRRAAPTDARPGRRVATVARWPLDVEDLVPMGWQGDAAIAVVRSCLDEYRAGRADAAARWWHDDITWTVRGPSPVGGEWVGDDRVFAYHALLERLSEGTFQQRLIALEGSRGSIVDAYLRTSATRGSRRLDIPTLAVFELVAGRIQRVTELPGDHDAWDSFWRD